MLIMQPEMEMLGKEMVVAYYKVQHSIRVQSLRKNVSQDNQCAFRDSKENISGKLPVISFRT
jgi:hypothetical protein